MYYVIFCTRSRHSFRFAEGLFPYEGAPDIEEIRGATRKALNNLVSFFLAEMAPLKGDAGSKTTFKNSIDT